jgi:uncharacterized protein DUF4124
MLRTVLVLVTALAALPASAQVYKCIEGGRTVYSQRPCPTGAQSTTMSKDAPSAPAPGADKAGGAPTTAEQEQAFRKRQKDKEAAQKKDDQKAAQAQERQRNCQNARQLLAQYEYGGRIAKVDANSGERVYLDDAQIAQEKTRAQESVRQWCAN